MTAARRAILAAWAASLVGIVLLSVYGRGVQRLVAANLAEGRHAAVVALLAAAAIATVAGAGWARGRDGALRAALLLPLLGLGLWLVPLPEERIHFLVFGVFGALTFAAFAGWRAVAVAITIAAGDEVLQAALPDRYFDVRDIAINSASALAGGWLVTKGSLR